MPHATLKMRPGVDQNRTPTLNEVAISSTNLVRFVPDKEGLGLVQKIGGWEAFYPAAMDSAIRALWAWEDTNAISHLGVGSESLISSITNIFGSGSTATISYSGDHIFSVGSSVTISGVVSSGDILANGYNDTYTITSSAPNQIQVATTEIGTYESGGEITSGENLFVISNDSPNSKSQTILTPRYEIDNNVAVDFTTVSGSAIVTITAANSNLLTGDTVYIKTQVSVGGIVLFGTYPVSYVSANQFNIVSLTKLGAPNPATSSVSNGGAVPVFTYTSGDYFVNVKLDNHGYTVGDTFPIIIPVLANDITLYGNYIVSSVVDANNFKIAAATLASTVDTFVNALSVTGNGTAATITFDKEYGFSVGNLVTVSGMTGGLSGFNGTYTVSAATTNSVSYTNATIATSSSPGGTLFRADGGSGSSVTLNFAGNYYFSVGDSVVVSGYTPSGYNGTYTVTASTSNSVSFVSASTGNITTTGTLFASVAKENEGDAYFEYYKTPGPTPTGTGYGVGGYGAGGYGIGIPGSGASSVGAPIISTDWTLDNWGEVFIACPVGGAIYQWAPISGSLNASFISNAPPVNDGMFVAMPQRQIVAWGSTFTGILDPLLIRWCDVNNYESWIASITNQAGSYRIPKGSKIIACIQGPQQGIIWTDIGCWAMQYVGPPYVYQFNEIGTGCGLIARKAAASMNNVVYWMGQSQFYRMSPGGGVEPIPCPVWDVIFQDLDVDNKDKIRIAPNSRFGEISWFYPTLSNGGEVSHYVKYNTILNQWDFGALPRTAWINESVWGPPIGAGTDYFIYQHEKTENAAGAPINASFTTGYFTIAEGELKTFVDQVWPDMKWGFYDQAQNATVNMTFYVTDYPGDTPRVYGPYPLTKATQYITPRFRGRLVSIKMESNDLNSFWRIGAMRYRFQQDGKF